MTQNLTVCLRTEILPIFWHTSRSSIGTPCRHWNPIGVSEIAKFAENHARHSPLPLEAPGLPSNTWMPGPTPLTTPNDSSIALWNSTQRRNKVPIGYNGTPQIQPTNCPFPFDDHHRNLIHPYRARPHSPVTTPNGIQIWSAVSPQYTYADRQTWDDMVSTNSTSL